MSWTRYLLHDFWTAREFNRLDDEQRAAKRVQRRRTRQQRSERAQLQRRLEDLEQGLDEATLLVRTLAELCVDKGVLTAEEVAAKAEQLDALDGVIDGRMRDAGGE